MSKATKTEPHNKPNILHLLEYCRIDRAADLLGCEISDLLHLQEMGEISLCWRFDEQPAITTISDIHMADTSDLDDVLSFGVHTFAYAEINGAIMDEQDKKKEISIILIGFWDAPDRGLLDELGGMHCFGRAENGDHMRACLPKDWQEPPAEELYIMRSDIARLRQAIEAGESLDTRQNNDTMATATVRQQSDHGKKSRLTNKQCAAFLLALQVAGFTEDDFNGSPTNLKDKILYKAAELGIDNARTKLFKTTRSETVGEWVTRGNG